MATTWILTGSSENHAAPAAAGEAIIGAGERALRPGAGGRVGAT